MHQPDEVVRLLHQLCIPGLSRRQSQILVACALGYSTDEIAHNLSLARPTVFRHIELLQARVFQFTDLTPSRNLLVAWTYLQRDCCTAAAWKMIENHQLFETGSQQLRTR